MLPRKFFENLHAVNGYFCAFGIIFRQILFKIFGSNSDFSPNMMNFDKRYSWEFVSIFITNNTAKIQLKKLGRMFRLTLLVPLSTPKALC